MHSIRAASKTLASIPKVHTGCRAFSSGARFMNEGPIDAGKPLPSTSDMKHERWDIANEPSKSGNIASQVFEMTTSLEGSAGQPLEVGGLFMRKFRTFDHYDPFDLSMHKVDITKRYKKYPQNDVKSKSRDPFERSGIDPLTLYTMPAILSRFLTTTGQILPRELTHCNSKNQKKLAIAIKRARACGLLSSVHREHSYLPVRHI